MCIDYDFIAQTTHINVALVLLWLSTVFARLVLENLTLYLVNRHHVPAY